MSGIHPTCLWPLAAGLGEGPVWHRESGALYFVDILGGSIHRLAVATGVTTTWPLAGRPGFLLPFADGSFLCGMQHGLYRFDPADGSCRKLLEVEPELPGNRINDGFVDPAGRLWFGTMDDGESAASGSLYQLGDDARLMCRDQGYVITNGPAMSPDGRTLYHGDTVARQVYAFDVGPDGALSRRRVFARPCGEGYPDGMAVDADGCLWIAIFGGARIERWSADGRLAGTVRLPCDQVTKLAFGGDDLRTVYVTTARKGLGAEALQRQPLAGGLFAFRAPVAGLPQGICRAWP
ncbi:gluconolaconase [Cupriavidus sp. USMAHM13]|uniref:SMP-30/gluconolactonase/LRE family protein n=1 Tax=Cupriavidus sp. USMAHM13 TaxID=1389192 RepID=UPI0008A6A73B|nr:SMP-30/gluconolactonase/LRE family protein [Cupriavidus sp. USMAHM13]AOZ02180.1 gluconolaconase [Cupriavidus sp. USMAHM13]